MTETLLRRHRNQHVHDKWVISLTQEGSRVTLFEILWSRAIADLHATAAAVKAAMVDNFLD